MGDCKKLPRSIDRHIRPLVEILNKVSYLSTFSSCQGHYEKEGSMEAHVLFNVSRGHEREFEGLAQIILAETALYWSETLVSVAKEYYVIPQGTELEWRWRISLDHIEGGTDDPDQRRRRTDKAIQRIVSVIKEYLNSEKKSFKSAQGGH